MCANSSWERQRQDVWFFSLQKRGVRGKLGTGCSSPLLWHLGAWAIRVAGLPFHHFLPILSHWKAFRAPAESLQDHGDWRQCPFCPQVSFRYHCRLYNEWRRNNQRVMLLIPKSANVPSTQQSLLGLQPLKRSSKETIVWFGADLSGSRALKMFFLRLVGVGQRAAPRNVLFEFTDCDCRGINHCWNSSHGCCSHLWHLLSCQTCSVSRDPMDSASTLIVASSSDANFFYCLKY